MKKLLFLLLTTALTLLTLTATAEMPEYMRGGIIKVTLKDGSTHEFKSEEFKVVPRKSKDLGVFSVSEGERRQAHQNNSKPSNLIFHLGIGQDGLKTDRVPVGHRVQSKTDLVGGLTYCKNITLNSGFCATGMSNQTYTLGVKFDLE